MEGQVHLLKLIKRSMYGRAASRSSDNASCTPPELWDASVANHATRSPRSAQSQFQTGANTRGSVEGLIDTIIPPLATIRGLREVLLQSLPFSVVPLFIGSIIPRSNGVAGRQASPFAS